MRFGWCPRAADPIKYARLGGLLGGAGRKVEVEDFGDDCANSPKKSNVSSGPLECGGVSYIFGFTA